MKNVELLKTTTTYKGKEYTNFFVKLPNNRILGITIPLLFSDKFDKKTKYEIINELKLVACDYEKKQK